MSDTWIETMFFRSPHNGNAENLVVCCSSVPLSFQASYWVTMTVRDGYHMYHRSHSLAQIGMVYYSNCPKSNLSVSRFRFLSLPSSNEDEGDDFLNPLPIVDTIGAFFWLFSLGSQSWTHLMWTGDGNGLITQEWRHLNQRCSSWPEWFCLKQNWENWTNMIKND